MTVRVEFFGIPRRRAGTASLDVTASTLGQALQHTATEIPALVPACIDGERPAKGYLTNINGERFTTDPDTPLCPGDAILLMSADAGG